VTRNGVEQQRQRHDYDYKTGPALLPPLYLDSTHMADDDTFRLIQETAEAAQDILDEDINAVCEDAWAAARQAWLGNIPANPYPAWDTRSTVWNAAFRSAYMQTNGK
jgi:hypothetical protein